MKAITIQTILFLLVLTAIPASATADVLLIEEVRASQNMDLPKRGSTQSQVESVFGAPKAKRAPVGDPPITRWEYETFSVYFEYQHVITSVLHHGAVIKESNDEASS